MNKGNKTGLWILVLLTMGAAHGNEIEKITGDLTVDGRMRYESADQTGLEQSDALTYRLRLGYEATLLEGVTFLAEGEGTADLQLGTYDAYPGAQGEEGHAVIADPQNIELNRLQLTANIAPVKAVIGRQRIIRNNARFIGNVGWRQNEQTYDAIGLETHPVESITLYYAYMDQANRIFGRRANVAAQREFEMKSHIIEAQYVGEAGIKAGIYAYLLGIENAAASSSDTLGIWLTGRHETGGGPVIDWRLEYADQADNSHSPQDVIFDLDYYHLTLGVSQDGKAILLGYEVLEGNGFRGFSTPLATLHAYNGFADRFLTTPGNGLEDLYVKASAKVTDSINCAIIYHEFRAQNDSPDYGSEIDAACAWKINANLSLTAKAALFDGSNGQPDVEKFWLQLDMKY